MAKTKIKSVIVMMIIAYFMILCVNPVSGIADVHEIRGEVATEAATWAPANFAGFFYDLDNDIGSEKLSIREIYGRTIEEADLTYSTSIQQVDYMADFTAEKTMVNNRTYPVIGLFGEEYVPLSDSRPNELVKLLLDNDDKYTLRTDFVLELPNGYELTAKQIDVEGNKVWIELSRNGEFIEDQVIDISAGPVTWTCETDVGNTDDVIVFRTLITNIFQGQIDSLVVIDGLYLVDYENVLEIEPGDEFGELEVGTTYDGTIRMDSTGAITLSKDDTIDIAEGMKFKVADSDML